MNNAAQRKRRAAVNRCIGCGCDEVNACDDGMGDGCYWLAVDAAALLGVCSQCPQALPRWKDGDLQLREDRT